MDKQVARSCHQLTTVNLEIQGEISDGLLTMAMSKTVVGQEVSNIVK